MYVAVRSAARARSRAFVVSIVGTLALLASLVAASSAFALAQVDASPAGQVTQTAATLREDVNPTGETVSDCHFDYGTTTEYGASAPCSPAPGGGATPVKVTARIEGLAEATVYHFRLVATTESGTAQSGDQKFETFPAESPPEFGHCVFIGNGTGHFENRGCTKSGGSQNYEWYPAFGSAIPLFYTRLKIEMKPKTEVQLHIGGGQVIACTNEKEVPVGEHTGNKTIGEVVLTFTGCHLGEAGTCQSAGAEAGEVATSSLAGEIALTSKSALGPLKDKVGLLLKPESGEVFATFSCGGTPVTVRGSVIGEAKTNSSTKKPPLKFVIGKTGSQQPTHFLGGEEHVLTTQVGEGPFERSALSFSAIFQGATNVEISTLW
ncbi:MAG TPA: hypothetical protein VLJ80_01565 [Solirubrobacteraceae bacterium]|nr:hypothetical protein [Solirubrobacteraceae bacterium]